jgi:hypothetical protein
LAARKFPVPLAPKFKNPLGEANDADLRVLRLRASIPCQGPVRRQNRANGDSLRILLLLVRCSWLVASVPRAGGTGPARQPGQGSILLLPTCH